jgi:hypothetical protein
MGMKYRAILFTGGGTAVDSPSRLCGWITNSVVFTCVAQVDDLCAQTTTTNRSIIRTIEFKLSRMSSSYHARDHRPSCDRPN